MRKGNVLLIGAAMLSIPGAATAQVANHVSFSMGFGLATHAYPMFGSLPSYGPPGGVGFGLSLSFGYDDYYGGDYYNDRYYHDDPYYEPYRPLFLLRPTHCWDLLWYDPFARCHGYFSGAYAVFDPWSWHGPWSLGFLGWPSRRYVRSHRWGFTPMWGDRYAWGFGPRHWYGGYGGWDWYAPTWGPTYGGYDDYGYPGGRVVQRSPLYGPRYKEYPTPPVYVTDNGPERPVSSAVPRLGRPVGANVDSRRDRSGAYAIGGRTARPRSGDDVRTARPRSGTDTRTSPPRVRARPRTGDAVTSIPDARPRTGTRGETVAPQPRDTRTARPEIRRPPVTTSRPDSRRPSTRGTPSRIPKVSRDRLSPPKVTTRPRPVPRTRIAPPQREAPKVRTAPSRGSARDTRFAPSRRPAPTTRSAPSRRPAPAIRSAPSRAPKPKARSAPSRGSAPKARPAPSRAPKPKARAAPRSSGRGKAPPRRPTRRPGS